MFIGFEDQWSKNLNLNLNITYNIEHSLLKITVKNFTVAGNLFIF